MTLLSPVSQRSLPPLTAIAAYPICRYRIRPAIVNTLSGNRAKTDFAHRTFKRSRRRDEATIGARQVVRVEHSADQRPLNAIRPGLSMSERPKSSSSSPCLFGLFDGLPEQHRRTAKAIEMGIGAAVLIHHLLSMADGQDAGNGPAGFGGDSNTGILPHPCYEILKPFERLRWKVVARPSQLEQAIQLLNQRRATTCFIGERFSLRTADLPLDAILVKSLIQRIETGPKIEPVQTIGRGSTKAAIKVQEGVRRPYFDILPPLPSVLTTQQRKTAP